MPADASAQGTRLADFLVIDGSHGEGAGQILGTALSLSIVTARGFRLENIRASRRNGGLRPQYLSAVMLYIRNQS